jgi:ACR3 family arsenite efflux pump ArsB
MNSINRYQSFIIALAVIAGLLAGQVETVASVAGYVIVPFLILMLFGLFLNIPINDLLKSFSNLKFFSANLAINFLWTPFFAWVLGYLFLQDHLSLWIGFVMLMITPCTDWYLIFTSIAKGNTMLSASVLPLNLILQVILLPVFLLLFFGASGSVNPAFLFESIGLVLIVPFVTAQTTKYLLQKSKKSIFLETKLLPFFELSQVLFLGLAIMAMFASQGDYLLQNIETVLILLIPLMIFFTINFLVSRFTSYLLNFSYEDSVSLNLTTLARNSPIALAIALTAFPDNPLVALALIIGPLIELPVLALVSQVLLKMRGGRFSERTGA